MGFDLAITCSQVPCSTTPPSIEKLLATLSISPHLEKLFHPNQNLRQTEHFVLQFNLIIGQRNAESYSINEFIIFTFFSSGSSRRLSKKNRKQDGISSVTYHVRTLEERRLYTWIHVELPESQHSVVRTKGPVHLLY